MKRSKKKLKKEFSTAAGSGGYLAGAMTMNKRTSAQRRESVNNHLSLLKLLEDIGQFNQKEYDFKGADGLKYKLITYLYKVIGDITSIAKDATADTKKNVQVNLGDLYIMKWDGPEKWDYVWLNGSKEESKLQSHMAVQIFGRSLEQIKEEFKQKITNDLIKGIVK